MHSKTSSKDVATVVEATIRRRKKGKLLLALGVLVGAGAVAVVVSMKRQQSSARARSKAELPPVERRDAESAEQAILNSDDAVADAEHKIDEVLSGTRRGRHAARE